MAQLISTTMQLAQHQAQLVFMDCFGKQQDVYLSLVSGPSQADKIASTLAAMTATEDAIKAWASANNIDLTAALAAGTSAINAALAAAAAAAKSTP